MEKQKLKEGVVTFLRAHTFDERAEVAPERRQVHHFPAPYTVSPFRVFSKGGNLVNQTLHTTIF